MEIYQIYQAFLEKKKKENIFREINILCEKNIDKSIKNNNKDRKIVDLTSNDYLNLKNDKFIKKELVKKIKKNPLSACSSRLLYNGDAFKNLENHLAKAFKKEACLIFASGFQLNQTVISAILNKNIIEERIIFSDRLNHSSIYEGINFQKNDILIRYQNCNLEELEVLLEKHKNSKNKFVLTESLFSMDGKILDIKKIIELKRKYNFFLFIDDCHATGVFGKNGYGLCEDFAQEIDLIMGSFSKAIPSQGGFVVCSNLLKDYLVNTAKGFIYSTALFLPSLFVAEIFFENLNKFQKKRQKLFQNCSYLISQLQKLQNNKVKTKKNINLNLNFKYNISPIIPIIIGENGIVDELRERLQKEENILVSKIKAPTVPLGTERIRLSIDSSISKKDLDRLVHGLVKIIFNIFREY